MQYGLRKAEETLAAASNLLAKLSGEQHSWRQQAASYHEDLQRLPQAAAVAAAFTVYAAAESEGNRATLMAEWLSLPGVDLPEGFTVKGFLTCEQELSEWRGWGLPGDRVLLRSSTSSLACHRYAVSVLSWAR